MSSERELLNFEHMLDALLKAKQEQASSVYSHSCANSAVRSEYTAILDAVEKLLKERNSLLEDKENLEREQRLHQCRGLEGVYYE